MVLTMSHREQVPSRVVSRGRFYLVVWNGRILHASRDRDEARAFHNGLQIDSAELIVGKPMRSNSLPQAVAPRKA